MKMQAKKIIMLCALVGAFLSCDMDVVPPARAAIPAVAVRPETRGSGTPTRTLRRTRGRAGSLWACRPC